MPTWRLREELRRQAREIVQGRADFERHTGRLSAKPLRRVDADPRELLQLLDALDEAERLKEEYHEQWTLAQRELEAANERLLHARRADGMELCEYDDEDWPCSFERARRQRDGE